MEPSEHIIYEGVLSAVPIGRLESGESNEMEMSICFLSYGRFEIAVELHFSGAAAHEDSRVGAAQIKVDIDEGS
jgi:trafficking protein particle complex subunit 9